MITFHDLLSPMCMSHVHYVVTIPIFSVSLDCRSSSAVLLLLSCCF